MKKRLKVFKSLLAVILCLMLTTGMLPQCIFVVQAQMSKSASAITLKNPRIVKDSSMTAKQRVTWDCVWFGSYPQSEVTSGDSVYNKLVSATGWNSNNDITLNGVKYRRMKEKDATFFIREADGYEYDSDCYYNWSDSKTYHYFKYEPIKWRVLKVSGGQALLMADIALDNQEYNDCTPVTWETSSIRSWLNGYGASSNQSKINYTNKNFMKTAFSSKEKTAILITNVENKNNLSYNTNGGNNTSDKVFLLSESEVYSDSAKSHGFVSDENIDDEARRCKSSTYAKAMGVGIFRNKCEWKLRSPGMNTQSATEVFGSGACSSVCSVDCVDIGVRPALNLKLSSSELYTYAGTVSSNGEIKASYGIKYSANGGTKAPATQIKKKNTSLKLSTKKPTRKGYTFKGWATSKSSTKVKYKAGATLSKTTNKNMTLYAVWKVNTYKITYKLNRGKNHSKNPSSYKVTTSTITLKNPTRKGYTFKGWYTSSSFKSSTKITKIAKGSTGNKTLYAKWKKK